METAKSIRIYIYIYHIDYIWEGAMLLHVTMLWRLRKVHPKLGPLKHLPVHILAKWVSEMSISGVT